MVLVFAPHVWEKSVFVELNLQGGFTHLGGQAPPFLAAATPSQDEDTD